jgi:tetratricopeptide (TPR) repeat protein
MPIQPSVPPPHDRLAQWWDKLVISLELADLTDPDTRARLDATAAKANNQGILAAGAWNYAAALPLLSAAIEVWSRLDHAPAEVIARNTRGGVLRKLGDLPAALDDHRTALALARDLGFTAGGVTALAGLGAAHVAQGAFDEAERAVQDALTLSAEADDAGGAARAQGVRGHLAEARKQWDIALAAYGTAAEGWQALGASAESIEALAGLARVALAQGYVADARDLIDRVLEHLGAHGPARLDEPLRLYWSIYQVLHVAREEDDAREILRAAYHLLERQAAGLNEQRQAQFTDTVAVNRAIREAWIQANAPTQE